MDWIKIKARHISPSFTNAQVGVIARFKMLSGQLKRMPREDEIYRVTSKKAWISAIAALDSVGIDVKDL